MSKEGSVQPVLDPLTTREKKGGIWTGLPVTATSALLPDNYPSSIGSLRQHPDQEALESDLRQCFRTLYNPLTAPLA